MLDSGRAKRTGLRKAKSRNFLRTARNVQAGIAST